MSEVTKAANCLNFKRNLRSCVGTRNAYDIKKRKLKHEKKFVSGAGSVSI